MRSAFQIRVLSGLCASAWLVVAAFSQPAFAESDRPPVILDTQTGIHDGQSGVILQNAPFVREPMVPAASAAPLSEPVPQGQPPIFVSPYIQLPTGAPASMSTYPHRLAPAQ